MHETRRTAAAAATTSAFPLDFDFGPDLRITLFGFWMGWLWWRFGMIHVGTGIGMNRGGGRRGWGGYVSG